MVKGPYLLLESRYLLSLGANYEEPGVVCHEGSRIVSLIPFFEFLAPGIRLEKLHLKHTAYSWNKRLTRAWVFF